MFPTIHSLPIFQAVLVFFGTLLSYIIAYSKKDVSIYLPFISETGGYMPEKGIFSLFLIIGSFLGILIAIFHFIILEKMLEEFEPVQIKINRARLVVGIAANIGLAGVAAFPVTSILWTHLLFAGVFFAGSNAYQHITVYLSYKIEKHPLTLFRFIVSMTMSIFLFILVIIFPLSMKRWNLKNSKSPALKEPPDEGFGLLFASSILEWIIALLILAFTVSLCKELKKYSFHVALTPVTPKSTINDEDDEAVVQQS